MPTCHSPLKPPGPVACIPPWRGRGRSRRIASNQPYTHRLKSHWVNGHKQARDPRPACFSSSTRSPSSTFPSSGTHAPTLRPSRPQPPGCSLLRTPPGGLPLSPSPTAPSFLSYVACFPACSPPRPISSPSRGCDVFVKELSAGSLTAGATSLWGSRILGCSAVAIHWCR